MAPPQFARITPFRYRILAGFTSSLVVLSPCIALFFIAQKYYIQGIVITGVKG